MSFVVVSIKVPANEATGLAKDFLEVGKTVLTEHFLSTILTIVLAAVLIWANRKVSGLKTEINRLTEKRKELMHGLESGELKTIPTHTPSKFKL